MMAHLDCFDAFSARTIDGEVDGVLVFFLKPQPAKGLMLRWHVGVERKADSKDTKEGSR
jgi:hypothetical protein